MENANAETHASSRQKQLESILPRIQVTSTQYTNFFLDRAKLDECSKQIETFEEIVFEDEEQMEGFASAQLPETLTLGDALNTAQTLLIQKVYESLKNNRQALIFVQGEAGTGKSFCIKEMHKQIVRHFGKNTLRCLGPTGVSAENLLPVTMTIHKGLCIDPKTKRVERLSAAKQPTLQSRYSRTRCFVIDEISMVSPTLLLQISQRACAKCSIVTCTVQANWSLLKMCLSKGA